MTLEGGRGKKVKRGGWVGKPERENIVYFRGGGLPREVAEPFGEVSSIFSEVCRKAASGRKEGTNVSRKKKSSNALHISEKCRISGWFFPKKEERGADKERWTRVVGKQFTEAKRRNHGLCVPTSDVLLALFEGGCRGLQGGRGGTWGNGGDEETGTKSWEEAKKEHIFS